MKYSLYIFLRPWLFCLFIQHLLSLCCGPGTGIDLGVELGNPLLGCWGLTVRWDRRRLLQCTGDSWWGLGWKSAEGATPPQKELRMPGPGKREEILEHQLCHTAERHGHVQCVWNRTVTTRNSNWFNLAEEQSWKEVFAGVREEKEKFCRTPVCFVAEFSFFPETNGRIGRLSGILRADQQGLTPDF